MALLIVAALEILGLVTAALALLGVPLVVGLMIYDVADARRREALYAATHTVVSAEQVRARVGAPATSSRLTA